MSLRLSGQNQLSYIGVTPLQPPDLVYIERDPISGAVQNADYRQFNVGTFWLNPVNDTLWILVRKGGTPPAPLWLSLGISPVALITHFTTDDANIVNPIALNVNIFGGSNINTTGASPTVTINLNPNIIVTSVITNTLTVNNDATFNGNILTNLSRGVVQSPGGGGALFSDEGTDGQILISSSAGAPAWANIISSDASITVTNGANSIDITTSGGSGTLNTLTGNSGVATAAAGNINVVTANSTPLFVGAGDTLTLDFLDAVNGNLVLGSDLPALTTGQFNTGVGALSLAGITSGTSNTAFGDLSLTTVSSGNDNTALGDAAGTNIALGSNNIVIGVNAGINYTNEDNNITIGNTGTVADSGAIRIGTFGTHTSAFIQGITTVIPGSDLVTVDANGQLGITSGTGALTSLTGNTGAPATPLAGNINIKTDNTTVLFDSGAVANQVTQDFGLSNLLQGSSGSAITLAANNVGYGLNALNLLTSGTDNSAVGAFSLSILTNGSRNTAVGFDTLQALTTQNDNTAVGYSSLNLSTGSNNTAFGSSSLNMLSTGMNNIAIGRLAGSALVAGESDNIYIGNTGVAADSGVTRIGTDLIQTTAFMAGVSGVTPTGPNQMVIMNASGQLGTQSIPAGGGTPSGFQVFTSNDTFTTPATTTADTVFEFTVVGGGGGGGGSSGAASNVIAAGGGSGATSIYLVTGLAPLLACPIVIGSGGSGGVGGNNGSSGGTSTATVNATVVTATGGSGGGQSASGGGAMAVGGVASNGTINIDGQPSYESVNRGGHGGNTAYGSGGGSISLGNGFNATGYGSGGGGARQGGAGAPLNGGNGSAGIVIVKFW